MKNIILFILIMFPLLNLNGNEKKLCNSSTLDSLFTNCQEKQLGILLYKVDSLIHIYHNEMTVSEAYHEYCEYLSNVKSIDEFEEIMSRDHKFYSNIINDYKSKLIFTEIWRVYKTKNRRSKKPSYEFLGFNQNGKYIKFLKILATNNNVISEYYDQITFTYDMPPSSAYGLLKVHNKFDFNNPLIRLVYSIHFITIHYWKDLDD